MNEEKTIAPKLKSRRLNKPTTEELKLKEKIAELESQLEQIRTIPVIDYKEDNGEEFEPVKADEYIKVMSLCTYTLNLTTLPHGGGRVFSFQKGFGEVKRIPYSYLADIIENHQKFAEEGKFYIMDNRVVKQHGLTDIYSKILTQEQIEQIFDGNKTDALSLYKMANAGQQKMINDMLVEKLRDNPNFDLNIIEAISKYSKVNLQERATFAREFAQDEEQNKQEEK